MGYWQCSGYGANERFSFWVIAEGGQLQEVCVDTMVESDGSLKHLNLVPPR